MKGRRAPSRGLPVARYCTCEGKDPRGRATVLRSIFFTLLACLPAFAHPMGNFSVNHYSGLKLSPDSLELRYIIDMAEIPTFQELQAAGITADPKDPRVGPYLSKKADEFWQGITLKIDGRPVELKCLERQVIFPPGAGGLPTMKFGFTCRAPLTRIAAGLHHLEYRDDNFPGRAGWKELIVNADPKLQLVSSAPQKDRSAELSNYPTDLLNSPPQDLQTSLSFTLPIASVVANAHKPAAAKHAQLAEAASSFALSVPNSRRALPGRSAAPITPAPTSSAPQLTANVQGTPRSAFTQLISNRQLSLWFLITAALIAMSLGALHALEPGHGKTLVAAYLVGSRGTARHAIVLGSIVTLAHTAGVYALGAITLYASRYILPEKIYPWLGVASGLIIAGLGLLLFMRRWVGEDPSLREDHSHWYDVFSSPSSPTLVDASSAAAAVPARQAISFKQLLILGITGGILPCPAALVVLLSAIALHRIAFGFFLIVTFSIGLAAVLIGIGLMFVHAGRWLHRLNPQSALVRRHLPLLSAAFITAIGVALTLQAIKSAGFAPHIASVIASPKWLLIAGVGLVLGMRHSTDPDHVIAVTTIVTRLRSLRSASLVGMIWGVGHTLTIFVVGSAIILFRIVIPPRIGLSMEFAVALMLILLGIMNLTGWLQWITDRFSPRSGSDDLTAPARSPELPLLESPARTNALQRLFTRFGAYQLLRPLAIGIVHGLAGSAAVALLVLATIHNPVWAMGYLLLFGSGTILGMMLMTAVIALPVVWTGKSFLRLNRYLCTTSGILSLAFGLFLVYQIGFVSGLFTSAPNWIPS